MKLIRCECGFVARGDSDDQVVGMFRGHMSNDHQALLETVSREDLVSWIQAEEPWTKAEPAVGTYRIGIRKICRALAPWRSRPVTAGAAAAGIRPAPRRHGVQYAAGTALVAQRIEHLTTDQKVGGSSPSERATSERATAGCLRRVADHTQI